MRHLSINALFFFLAIFVFSSCTKEETIENTPVKQFEGVDEVLWPYYMRFEEEAASRGIHIDLQERGITGTLSDIEATNVAGKCNYHPDHANHVTVDNEFWANSSDLRKELVIFHELGHCYLLRNHNDDAHVDGTCVSIMRSGLDDCKDNYLNGTRDSYLTELFEVN